MKVWESFCKNQEVFSNNNRFEFVSKPAWCSLYDCSATSVGSTNTRLTSVYLANFSASIRYAGRVLEKQSMAIIPFHSAHRSDSWTITRLQSMLLKPTFVVEIVCRVLWEHINHQEQSFLKRYSHQWCNDNSRISTWIRDSFYAGRSKGCLAIDPFAF